LAVTATPNLTGVESLVGDWLVVKLSYLLTDFEPEQMKMPNFSTYSRKQELCQTLMVQ
jgi:hypothetical protein